MNEYLLFTMAVIIVVFLIAIGTIKLNEPKSAVDNKHLNQFHTIGQEVQINGVKYKVVDWHLLENSQIVVLRNQEDSTYLTYVKSFVNVGNKVVESLRGEQNES